MLGNKAGGGREKILKLMAVGLKESAIFLGLGDQREDVGMIAI